ncbi:MAG: heavy metal translocating P-type ATPase [Spongiibacteraceae bacterium]
MSKPIPPASTDHSVRVNRRAHIAAEPEYCYHCGLSIAPPAQFTVATQEGIAPVCCPGCKAVVETINASGLQNYYRFRENIGGYRENIGGYGGNAERSIGIPEPAQAAEFSYLDQPEFIERWTNTANDGERRCELLIDGMHCAACVWLLEQRLQHLPGVKQVYIDFDGARGSVEWNPAQLQLSEICAAIATIGYKPEPYRRDRDEQLRQHEQRTMLRRLGVAGIGMMQVSMLALGLYAGAIDGIEPLYRNFLRWVSLLVSIPVLFYAGMPFLSGAWRSLRARKPGMDMPIALALLLAFAASVAATVQQNGDVYFDSITMFIFLLLGARYLEMRARHFRHNVGSDLLNLLPNAALKLDSNGKQSVVPIEQLHIGDRVLVRSGETIPADGHLLDAHAQINESAVSGEYFPVSKRRGDALIAGTLNGATALTLEVSGVGAQLRIAAIQRLTRQAQQWKPRLAQIADRIASIFTLGVIGLAALTYLIWSWAPWPWLDAQRALWVTLSVLVVSCPCALSLATPMAITTATNALRRAGILVTRAEVWEQLDRITDVVFDKTGTLSEGRVSIAEIVACGNRSADICRDIAEALETGSSHPIAQAFTTRTAIPALDRVENIGAGVEGSIAGRRYRLGKTDYALELFANGDGTKISAVLNTRKTHSGHWILLADSDGPLCWFRLQDQLRADAAATVQALQQRGLRVHILSGDNSDSAAELGAQLHIDRVESGASPERKLDYLAALQNKGRRVLMVGDGINDIPVLAAADISVAMSGASQLAKTNADCILLTPQLNRIATLFDGAKKTRNIVRENLIWALLYNVVAIPLAAAGWIAPWLAAIGMSASSLLVTANALRLKNITDGDSPRERGI